MKFSRLCCRNRICTVSWSCWRLRLGRTHSDWMIGLYIIFSQM